MKKLIILLLIAFKAFGQNDADYVTGGAQDLDDYVVLTTPNCEHLYYVPKYYEVEPNLSSVLTTEKKDGDGKSHRIINLMAAISPVHLDETTLDKKLSSYTPVNCFKVNPTRSSYPNVFQNLIPDQGPRNGISISWVPLRDYKHVLRFEIDPALVSIDDVLDYLRFFTAQQKIRVFSQKIDAFVQLTASYEAASEFSEKWWSDRVCRQTSESKTVLGVKVGSRNSETCEDIPRMAQLFKGAQYKNTFVFERTSIPNIPEEKINALENELISRLLHSLYLESKRIQEGNLTIITLGQLNKQSSGVFRDHITLEHFDESNYVSSIRVPKLAEAVEKNLRNAFETVQGKRK